MEHDFPNFAMLEDEMIARRLNMRFEDIDWEHLYLDVAGLNEQLSELGLLGECLICFERKFVTSRPCCDLSVCKDCLRSYYSSLISNAIVKIQCIGYSCNEFVPHEELILHLDDQMRQRFRQFLVDANKNPNQKTCPRCHHITDLDQKAYSDANSKKFGIQVTCVECELVWCFRCQGPWHEALSCKEYQRGDALFKSWTKRRQNEQMNAQKCPKCKVFIQRSSGCDHMTCNRCSTDFCYQCGEKYRSLKFIGNHQSRLSILGCKYRFKPEDPVRRRLVRGSIFGGKLLAAPLIGGLALGAGAVVLGIGLVALPFYGGYQLHKLVKNKKREKMMKIHRHFLAEQIRARQRELNELERARRDGISPHEFDQLDLKDIDSDLTLSDLFEATDVDIGDFNWEPNPEEAAAFYLHYYPSENPESEWTQDDVDFEIRQEDDRDSSKDCGKGSFEVDPDVPECSFYQLNPNCDITNDGFHPDASFCIKNPNLGDVSDVMLMVKCSEKPEDLDDESEISGDTTEAGTVRAGGTLPKSRQFGVLVRRHCTRSRSHVRGSDRPVKNKSGAVIQETADAPNQTGSDNDVDAAPSCEGVCVAPCDMVTHL